MTFDRIRRVLTRRGARATLRREPVTDWRVTFTRRVRVAAAIVALWVVGIEARLVHLQVYRHQDLVTRASRQQTNKIEAPAERGDIVDRKGRVLATSVDTDSIYADPSIIDNADEAV